MRPRWKPTRRCAQFAAAHHHSGLLRHTAGRVWHRGRRVGRAKYRFIQETAKCPQIGVFPLLEVPTGNSRLGLGNGQLWARLPLWIQKSYGPWTTYGGVGYQINHAPAMKDSLFAGW